MSDIGSSAAVTSDAAGGTGGRPGTLRAFKRLRRGEMATIRHGMHGFPLVDVYELDFFDAVTSADELSMRTPVQFYVYHSSDGTAAVRLPDGSVDRVTVEDSRDPYHLPFTDALRMVGVEYEGGRHLGDVVNEFWSALFSSPSDQFDETSFGVSPWLERDIGDRRTIESVRPDRGGEWDNLRFRFRPRKTLNWPPGWFNTAERETTEVRTTDGVMRDPGAPPGVEVLQLDLQTVGLRLLGGHREEVGVMVLLRS